MKDYWMTENLRQNVLLIHNSGAGENNISGNELVSLIRTSGNNCTYYKADDPAWHQQLHTHTIVAIAGGDGTIREVARQFLQTDFKQEPPSIGLLPFGTANNIATSVGVNGGLQDIISNWNYSHPVYLSVGQVNFTNQQDFFLESYGFGLFAELMKQLQDKIPGKATVMPDIAVLLLQGICKDYYPRHCSIRIDDQDFSGEYLMVEIMNTPLFGPNLQPSTTVNPDDSRFDILLIQPDQRGLINLYLENKLAGKNHYTELPTVKGREIKIQWGDSYGHLDDELTNNANQPAEIILHKMRLRMLTGKSKE